MGKKRSRSRSLSPSRSVLPSDGLCAVISSVSPGVKGRRDRGCPPNKIRSWTQNENENSSTSGKYRRQDYHSVLRRNSSSRPRRRHHRPSSSLGQHRPRSPSYSLYHDDSGHYIYGLGESVTRRYKILALIGEGTFARVFRCWDREMKSYVAMKMIRAIPRYLKAAMIEVDILRRISQEKCRLASHLDLKNEKDAEIQEDVSRSRISSSSSAMHETDSSHCIEMVDYFRYRGHICIIYPEYGLSLYEFIRKNRYRGFLPLQVRSIARQLLEAIKLLHSMKLIHTDLKPENILLKCSDYSRFRDPKSSHEYRFLRFTDICVIDFGSAVFDDESHSSIIATRHYRAPEVILLKGWSYPADLWAVGCILIELYTGDALFQTHSNREHLAMMERILGPLPANLTDKGSVSRYIRSDGSVHWPVEDVPRASIEFVSTLSTLREMVSPNEPLFLDLLLKLLCYDPKQRLTVNEALEHPYFGEEGLQQAMASENIFVEKPEYPNCCSNLFESWFS